MYNLTTVQVIVKNPKGRVLTVSKRFTEKDLKAYKDELKKQCESVGLVVEDISFGYNDLPENQAITPIPLPLAEKKKPEEPIQEDIDLSTLPQYQSKPKLKLSKYTKP